MSYGLGRPEEPGVAVLYPGHGRGVAESDGEDVHEGGVRGRYQDRGLLPAHLLPEDPHPEAQHPEGDVAADGPHGVLEHSPPADVRREVPEPWVREEEPQAGGGPDEEGKEEGEEDPGGDQEGREEQEQDLVPHTQLETVREDVGR